MGLFQLKKRTHNQDVKGKNFENKKITNQEFKQVDAKNSRFWQAKFINADASYTDFSGSDFQSVTIENADFRGTKFNNIRNFETITGLSSAKFNDNTELDGVNLDGLAKNDPVAAFKLKQIRYIGKIKRNKKLLYWLWKISCDCGRSWKLLLFWAAVANLCFGFFYYFCSDSNLPYLPHVYYIDNSINSPLSFSQSLQFSSLSFVSFNMPNVIWKSTWTGIWVVIEIWCGLAFLGLFVTVISTKVIKNEIYN